MWGGTASLSLLGEGFVFIFGVRSGPCQLPLEVLEDVQRQLLNYKGSGQSVMEMVGAEWF